MTMAAPRFDSHDLNLKATELRLALPGSDEQEQPTSFTSRKRSSCDLEDDQTPPSKTQIIGWPPVQSYRKNNYKSEKQANGSGLYVKVNMDGAPYLRKIDIKAYKSYIELLEALESMFNVKIGDYTEKEGYGESIYAPSYQDKDGDWMLVGDVPWEMFVSSCKRLRIIKSEAKQFLI